MKKFASIFALLFIVSAGVNAQNRIADAFFNKYSDVDDALTVDLSGSFLNFLSGIFEDEDEEGFEQAISDLSRIKIVSVDRSMVSNAEVESLKRGFLNDRLEEYAVIKEGKKKNYVMAKGDKVITEVAILSFGESNFSMIYFEGKMDPKTLGELIEGDGMHIKFGDDKDDN